MGDFYRGGPPPPNLPPPQPYGESSLSWRDFQRIWRRMPRVSSGSAAERWRRRTRRRIFSSVGAAEGRFWEPLGFGFRQPLERRASSKSAGKRSRSAAGGRIAFG